jgi:hypothetical protein
MLKKATLAYVLFLLSSLILIGFFLNFGNREGYIVSDIKWSIYGLAVLVNIIFIIVSVYRFIQYKSTTKNEILLSILGITPIILLLIYIKLYKPSQRLDKAKSEVKQLAVNDELKNGDLIFQTSLSGQSKAIQLATKSKYSHCGLIFKDGNDFYVFEAVQPVKRTQLDKWIARGKDGKFVIKRLKNADKVLTPAILSKMKQVGDNFNGKNYDLTFEWSDDKIYCSELIWKIYQRSTGLEIGKLEKLSDFDLTNGAVKKKMKERYGDKIPTEEIVISPAAIFDSELLTTVKLN